MKTNIKILSILLVSLAIGCQNDLTLTENQENQISMENQVFENFLYSGNTIYEKYLITDAPVVGYSSARANARADEELYVYDINVESNQSIMKRVQAQSLPSILVNGQPLSNMQSSYLKATSATSPASEFFGTNVSFKITRSQSKSNHLAKNTNVDTTITMYVPEVVRITSPPIVTQEDLIPYCYYEDFVIKWTPDPLNENGLVVMATWSGIYLNGAQEAKYVRNIDIIENDNGVATLNNKLFDNIPEGAVANLILLRGNISIFEDSFNDNLPYRLMATTHEILPFIMLRHLN